MMRPFVLIRADFMRRGEWEEEEREIRIAKFAALSLLLFSLLRESPILYLAAKKSLCIKRQLTTQSYLCICSLISTWLKFRH